MQAGATDLTIIERRRVGNYCVQLAQGNTSGKWYVIWELPSGWRSSTCYGSDHKAARSVLRDMQEWQ